MQCLTQLGRICMMQVSPPSLSLHAEPGSARQLTWASAHWGDTRMLILKLSAEGMRDAEACAAIRSGAGSLASLRELHVLISRRAWCFVQPPWLEHETPGAAATVHLQRVKAPKFGVILAPGMGNLRHIVLLSVHFLGPERGGSLGLKRGDIGPLESLQALRALETLYVEGQLIQSEDTYEVLHI